MSLATNAAVKPTAFAYPAVIDEICGLKWTKLSSADLTNVAWAYYYFSVQFREKLEIARRLYPNDENLLELDQGERNTANLSPWPGVAAAGEAMNHDEFMRRTLLLSPVEDSRRTALDAHGKAYLTATRAIDDQASALSIASYEDGGLEAVFGAILTAPTWDTPLLAAFKHFLAEHIRFDSDPDAGHGALCRHLPPDDRVLPLWTAFRTLLVSSAPALKG